MPLPPVLVADQPEEPGQVAQPADSSAVTVALLVGVVTLNLAVLWLRVAAWTFESAGLGGYYGEEGG